MSVGNKLNRNWTDWEYLGWLTGNNDFYHSDARFQEMFSSGYYYAKFNPDDDTWMFTKEAYGDKRYPHYTATFDGAYTSNEHFTYDELWRNRKARINASNLRRSDTKEHFIELLDEVVSDYPSVKDYMQ